RETVEDTRAAQQFEVIEPLVAGDLTRLRNRDGPSQQESAAVAPVADSLRTARQPGHCCRIESVLQENGAIVWSLGEFETEADALPPTGRVVRNNFIDRALSGVKVGDPGPRHQRNLSLREMGANGAQSGQRHDGVAHPIRSADEKLVDRAGVQKIRIQET